MCLNFIEEGYCHVTGGKCILGSRGATARNEQRQCELHGGFDVWLTQGKLLMTDLGFPPDEPVQSIGLGVSEAVASRLAAERSKHLGVPIITSQRRCIECGCLYWVSNHAHTSGLTRREYVIFCPTCLDKDGRHEIERRLVENRHWCG